MPLEGIVAKDRESRYVPGRTLKWFKVKQKDYRKEARGPDPDEHVLVNQHSAPYTRTSLGQLIERIGRRAGIQRFPVRPHVLRHTLNIIRRRAKIDPTLRSQLLTHSNPSSLAAYEHVLDGELAQAREQQRQGLGQYLGDYVTRLGALPPTDPPKSLNPCLSILTQIMARAARPGPAELPRRPAGGGARQA